MGKEFEVSTLGEMCNLMCDNNVPEKEHNFCLRCGRKLKSEKARLKGYGDVCEKKMKVEHKRRLFEVRYEKI